MYMDIEKKQYIHIYIYIYTHTHTHIYTHIHAHLHTHAHTQHIHMYLYIYAHTVSTAARPLAEIDAKATPPCMDWAHFYAQVRTRQRMPSSQNATRTENCRAEVHQSGASTRAQTHMYATTGHTAETLCALRHTATHCNTLQHTAETLRALASLQTSLRAPLQNATPPPTMPPHATAASTSLVQPTAIPAAVANGSAAPVAEAEAAVQSMQSVMARHARSDMLQHDTNMVVQEVLLLSRVAGQRVDATLAASDINGHAVLLNS